MQVSFFFLSVSVCIGVKFACTFFFALGDGGGEGAFCFNISAIRESNEKKTSMEVATFLKEMVGEGECWSTGTRQRTIFIVTIIDATPVNDDVCVNCVVPT